LKKKGGGFNSNYMLSYVFQNETKKETQEKLRSFWEHEYHIAVQITPRDSKVISRPCAPPLELQIEEPRVLVPRALSAPISQLLSTIRTSLVPKLRKGIIRQATVVELRPINCHLQEHERALPDKHTLLSDCGCLSQLHNTGQEALH
jgi:hypothetical protein